MLYDIRIEFRDGTVEKFQRKSNIKPLNGVKLNDKIARQLQTVVDTIFVKGEVLIA